MKGKPGLGTKAYEKVWCAQEQQMFEWLEQSLLSVTLGAVTRELKNESLSSAF